MAQIWVKPHSLDRAALVATEETFRRLHGGGSFMVEDGLLVTHGEWVAVDVLNPEFIMWASVRQGYVVAAALVPDDPKLTQEAQSEQRS